jgi:LPS sulfotransferase NodH
MASERIIPNFFVVGAQKTGTTFLCTHLSRHAEVSFGKRKELFFFSRPRLDEAAFENYLARFFAPEQAKPGARFFAEGTANYFNSARALGNMTRFLGSDFKAVVSLRHPVTKTISWYMHSYRRGRLDGSESILSRYFLQRARYARHLQRWFDALGRERFLAITYDMLEESPLGFVNAATNFLGIAPVTELPPERVNAGGQIIQRHGYVQPVLNDKRNPGQILPRFSLKDIAELQRLVAKDIKQTEALTGLDLSRWLELPKFAPRQMEKAAA